MPLDNLRAFVDAIDAAGELARVDRAVSVDKEITEVADRCMKSPAADRRCCSATRRCGTAAPRAIRLP